MTTAMAIVVAAAIWSATQIGLSLVGWFVAFPWQREYERRSPKWCVFPTLDAEDKKESESRNG